MENNDIINNTYDNLENTSNAVEDNAVVDTSSIAEEYIDNEFINDENMEEFKLMNLLSKRNDIKNMVNKVEQGQKRFVSDDALLDHIESAISDLDVEAIQNLTDDEITNIFTIDGEEHKLDISVDDPTKEIEFKRDFLVLSKKSNDAMRKFDEEMNKIETEISTYSEDLKEAMNEFGNMSNLIRSKIANAAETTDDDGKRDLYNKLLVAFDNGYTLDNVKEYYTKYSHKAKGLIGDYHNNKKSHYIYRKYKRVIESLNIDTDLTKFPNLETQFLSQEFHDRHNIFLFAIISMVASWEGKNVNKIDGLFLTQFCINIKNLFYNKFDNEETKAKFIGNIIDVLDIIV